MCLLLPCPSCAHSILHSEDPMSTFLILLGVAKDIACLVLNSRPRKCSFVTKMADCVTVNDSDFTPPPPPLEYFDVFGACMGQFIKLLVSMSSLVLCMFLVHLYCSCFLHRQFAFLLTSMYTQQCGCILCQ